MTWECDLAGVCDAPNCTSPCSVKQSVSIGAPPSTKFDIKDAYGMQAVNRRQCERLDALPAMGPSAR